jgi:hypothetical protein
MPREPLFRQPHPTGQVQKVALALSFTMFTKPVPFASCRSAVRQISHRRCYRLASEVIECQALAKDSLCYEVESLGIRQLAVIVAEVLFVQIAEEMKRLYADVSPRNAAFEQAQVILQPVRV